MKAAMQSLVVRLNDAETKLKLLLEAENSFEVQTQEKLNHLTTEVIANMGAKVGALKK